LSAFLRAHLRAGMNVIDIGANVGVVSAVAANIVGPTGRVIAYEPTPSLIPGLNERFHDAENVEVRHSAVAGHTGTTTFLTDLSKSTVNTLYAGAIWEGATSVTVPVCSLDDEMSSLPPIDVIKIDAQGAEARIFAAARRLLKRDKPLLIFELWEHGLSAAGTSANDILDALARFSYHFHPLNAKGEVGRDSKIHRFLAGLTRAKAINVVGHPRRWPGHRWRGDVIPLACITGTRSCPQWTPETSTTRSPVRLTQSR
jgi:FkbM family methyltransferase